MSQKISFIGLGAMGQPMASNIAKTGIELSVFDIVTERMAPVVACGARAADSLAHAAEGANIVITMLPATDQVLDVLSGPNAILDVLANDAIVMDMSTIAPSATDRVAHECHARGVRFIDAPVGRLVMHAQRGESLFMIGCDDEAAFHAVEPLLDAMGTTVHRCGPVGSGIRTKIVNNFMILSIAQVTAEGLTLATSLGLDIELLKRVNADTSGTNGQFQLNFANKVLIGDTSPGFTIDLAHKDMSLALTAAAEQRLGLPLGAATHAVYGSARAGHYAQKDFTALLEYACELANLEPPRLEKP